MFSRVLVPTTRRLVAVAFLCLIPAAGWAFGIEAVYRGLDKAVLKYTLADNEKITMVDPSGGESDLLSGPATDAIHNLNGLERGSDADPKTYTFHQYTWITDEWVPWDRNPCYTLEMDDGIQGELQADETIAGSDAPEDVISYVNVVVPDGRTISISKFAINASSFGVFVTAAPWYYSGLRVVGGGRVRIDDCRMGSFSAQGAVDVEVKNSHIGGLNVYGASPKISGCEIGLDALLYNRNEAEITDCLILGRTEFRNMSEGVNEPPKTTPFWNEAASPNPTISGNAMMGHWCFNYLGGDPPPSPIPIGANYYGDPEGYADGRNDGYGLFESRGARILAEDMARTFDIAGPIKKNPNPVSDRRTFPKFWNRNISVGQNTFPTGRRISAMQGRETLAAVDVVADDVSVDGAKVYCVLSPKDGTPLTIYSKDSDKTIHRDYRDYGHHARDFARSTFNFILPPVSSEEATIAFYVDSTGVTGYEGSGSVQSLGIAERLMFSPPYGRPLRILVTPVTLLYPFYNKNTPSPGAMGDDLKKLMLGMLPLGKDDIVVHTSSPIVFAPSFGAGPGISIFQTFTSLSSTLTMNAVANNLWLRLKAYNLTNSEGYDFIVGVLASGNMGKGVNGASWIGRRSVLLVSEGKASAALHEMGHAFGLYTMPFGEQYQTYPELGLELTGVTTFVPEPGLALPQFKSGAFGRVMNHPPVESAAYIKDGGWFDVMGAGLGTTWMINDTYQSFRSSLRSLLGTKTAPRASDRPNQDIAAPVAEGMKRITMQGIAKLEIVPDDFWGDFQIFRFVEGAVRAFAEGSVAMVEIPPDTAYPREKVYFLRCYDASDAQIHEKWFSIEKLDFSDDQPPYTSWIATFDIPEETAWFEVVRLVDDKVYLRCKASETLNLTIDAPAPGTALGATLDAQWTATAARPSSPSDPYSPASPDQPLQYAVWFKTDETTWTLQTMNYEDDRYSVPTDFLPQSDSLSMMVQVSDGINTAEAVVSGLSLGNRPPTARIVSPTDGDLGATQTLWTLSATAYDVEDGALTSGVWTSSIDDWLGTGTLLTGVRLSEGTHEIDFTTSDTEGLEAVASVSVSVAEITSPDLSIEPGDLVIASSAVDPSSEWPAALAVGTSATAQLTVRAGALSTTGVASLYWTPPDESESLLVEATVELPSFGEETLSARVIPPTTGTYEFRATLTDFAPDDPEPSNNERIWTWSTDGYADLDLRPPAMSFTSVTSATIVTTRALTVANNGDAELVVTTFTLAGTQAGDFYIAGAPAGDLRLAPETSTTLTVSFAPIDPGEKQARIDVVCNDPLKPVGSVALYGLAESTPPLVERVVQTLLGAAPPNDANDSNDDGVVDIADYIYLLLNP